jgi:hypothetical protein
MEYDRLFPDFPGQDGDVSAGFEDRVWKKIARTRVERRVMAGGIVSLALIAVLLIVPGKAKPPAVEQAQANQTLAAPPNAGSDEVAVNAQMINASYTGDGQYAIHPVVYKPRVNRF